VSGDRHAVGVFQRQPFHFVVPSTGRVLVQGEELFIRDAEIATDGSVDVLSEVAAVEAGNPAVDERYQFWIE
jgi:hypothetical protein